MPAPEAVKEFPITFEKGLVTEIEDSTLELGQASVLVNWEPTAQGGLRARNRWAAISTSGLTAPYTVRGWGTYAVGASVSGYQDVNIVQQAASSLTDPERHESSKEATLSSVTVGNILVAVVTYADVDGTTVFNATAGYTLRASTQFNPYTAVRIYTDIADSATEVFTASVNVVGAVHHVHLFEVSGLASEVPTDTDAQSGSGDYLLSADSGTSVGFAVSAGYNSDNVAFQKEPGDQGSWVTQLDVSDDGSVGLLIDGHTIVATQIYSATPVTDNVQYSVGDVASFGLGIWDAASAASTPAEFFILLAVATATGYSLYQVPRGSISSGTWTLIDSVAVSDSSAPVSITVGSGSIIWTSATMAAPRQIIISTLTPAVITDLADKAGRAAAYHKDRIFVAGSTLNPSRVYFSGIGTPDTFTTATDYLDIGGEDGEAIEDLVSVEGLLLVCKTNRLYLISGSGIESFFVNELPGGSAAVGRPAVRTPYGTIVAGPDDIWVVQGGGVEPMSRPLGAEYNILGAVSSAYAQDSVLIADSSTGRAFRTNLVTGSWSEEAVASGENQIGSLFGLQSRIYYGVQDSSTQVGGTRRLSSARTYDLVTGGTSFEAATGKLSLLGPSTRYTPRYLFLQLRNQDPDHGNALHITITSDLGEEIHVAQMEVEDEVIRIRKDLGRHKNAEWLQIAFSMDSSEIAGAIDVEKAVLGLIPEPAR